MSPPIRKFLGVAWNRGSGSSLVFRPGFWGFRPVLVTRGYQTQTNTRKMDIRGGKKKGTVRGNKEKKTCEGQGKGKGKKAKDKKGPDQGRRRNIHPQITTEYPQQVRDTSFKWFEIKEQRTHHSVAWGKWKVVDGIALASGTFPAPLLNLGTFYTTQAMLTS